MFTATLTPVQMKGYIDMSLTIEVRQGAVKALSLAVSDAQGLPVDLTDGDLIFVVKRDEEDADPLITKEITTGITLTDAEAGLAEIQLDAIDTSGLSPRTYLYEIRFTNADQSYSDPVIPLSPFVVKRSITL